MYKDGTYETSVNMTSLMLSMSKESWRACAFVFNLNDDVCFEIGNALRRFIFLGGSVQPALSNCGLSPIFSGSS